MIFTNESLSLVFPTPEYEEKAKDIINEMHEYNSDIWQRWIGFVS